MLLDKIKPDEIYNLAAQSHVKVFEIPDYTTRCSSGTLRFLEAIKSRTKMKFYQASTSELYGKAHKSSDESTKFYPRSPYGYLSFTYWIIINYREAYGIFACNGILFNHESPRRGETLLLENYNGSLSNKKEL